VSGEEWGARPPGEAPPPADGAAPDALRELVREVLRDVLPGLAGQAADGPPRAAGGHETASPPGVTLRPVRLATDEELHKFVLHILALADNPKRRRDLLAGRLRFTLAPGGRFTAAVGGPGNTPGPVIPAGECGTGGGPADHRIEKGAVTERAVQAAATAGARLVLGPRAVLTPLARDRARALGVPIEKER
jgi:hypothetical protein